MQQTIKAFLLLFLLMLLPKQIYAQVVDASENVEETIAHPEEWVKNRQKGDRDGPPTLVQAAGVDQSSCTEYIENGSFETLDLSGWSYFYNAEVLYDDWANVVELSTSNDGRAMLMTTIYVPEDANNGILSIMVDTTTFQESSSELYLNILVGTIAERILIDPSQFFDSGWSSWPSWEYPIALSDYAGQSVSISFELHSQDVNSSVQLDFISLSNCNTEIGLDDIYEPDGESGDATLMGMDRDAFYPSYSIIPGSDEDWIYFDVDEQSIIYLSTYGEAGDTVLWLYDESLYQIGYNDDKAEYDLFSTLITECLSPGRYYAKVTGHNQQEIANYSLNLYSESCQSFSHYFSSSTGGQAGGVGFADEDIMAFDPVSEQWSRYFDGSDVGLRKRDVDAFHILDDGNILLSLDRPRTIGGVRYDDSDIIKFTATSLGNRTRGSFSMYFDGSDVQLRTNAEDIDAIAQLANGDLVISTLGTARVTGAVARDEDMLRFHKTRLGNRTVGTWSIYMDGSDMRLSHRNEDIWALSIDETTNSTYMSTYRNYNISYMDTTLQGDSDDIFTENCMQALDQTECGLSRFWDGDAHGFNNELIDGYFMGSVPPLTVFSAAVDADDADDEVPEVDDESEDVLDDDEYTEHNYLPFISR